jgi:hypothetical protein
MKRFLLGVVCVFVGGTVTAVKVTNRVLDRLDAQARRRPGFPVALPTYLKEHP